MKSSGVVHPCSSPKPLTLGKLATVCFCCSIYTCLSNICTTLLPTCLYWIASCWALGGSPVALVSTFPVPIPLQIFLFLVLLLINWHQLGILCYECSWGSLCSCWGRRERVDSRGLSRRESGQYTTTPPLSLVPGALLEPRIVRSQYTWLCCDWVLYWVFFQFLIVLRIFHPLTSVLSEVLQDYVILRKKKFTILVNFSLITTIEISISGNPSQL